MWRSPCSHGLVSFAVEIVVADGSPRDSHSSGTLTCASRTIFDRSPLATDSWTEYFCANSGFSGHTVYREIAATTAESTAQTSAASQTADPASSTSIPEPSTVPYDDYSYTDTENPSSKAWIAGAVAGPVVALAALGGFAFWYRRRKAQTAKTGGKYSPQPSDGYTQQPYSVSDSSPYEVAGNPISTSPGWQGVGARPVSELETVEMRYKAPLVEALQHPSPRST